MFKEKYKTPKGSFRRILIISSIALIVASLLVRNNKTLSFAIASPDYPSKIGFEDFDEEINRREDIDASFLNNLNKFSIQSSSEVLMTMDRKSNSLYSPISFYMALAMLAETAEGETQNQIVQALNMGNMDIIQSETAKLFRQLYFHNEIGRLTLANSLWLNENVDFNKDKLETLAETKPLFVGVINNPSL